MNLYNIINVVLLLQLQGFHSAWLQTTTDTPGRAIDPHWLRHLKKIAQALTSGSGDVNEDGTAEASMVKFDGSNIMPSTLSEATTEDPELLENLESQVTTVEPELPVSVALNSSHADNEEDSGLQTTTITPNTTHQITENPNAFNYTFNETEFNETSTVPDINSTEASPNPNGEKGVFNDTVDNSNVTTTVTEFPSDTPKTTTPEISPKLTNTTAPSTTDDLTMSTVMESGSTLANISDRALESGTTKNKNSVAWGAILGTGLAVCFVAMVAYVLLRKRGRRDFTHRKLVEEFPSDPVLRLDNNEPLDLKYDGSAYYNPGLQMDHIQMTNFPQGHQH
ncbi:mucin-15 [Esox lucius]|uniref:Mucin 15, cell surface associated n=1 Tax=Esox lucius TaxID=8010 RepID=A0AAY5LCX1_ESOLU|nr:mucin-15 [Esox lucius]